MRTLYLKSGYNYGRYPIHLAHPTRILLELEPVVGYYTPDVLKPKPRILGKTVFKNKGYRNIAYLFNIPIIATTQALIDRGGTSRSILKNFQYATGYACYLTYAYPILLNFGSMLTPHDVSRYELYDPFYTDGVQGIWWGEEYADRTEIKSLHNYGVPIGISVGEVGLYWQYAGRDTFMPAFLLCRSIIDPPITRVELTRYTDGYELEFPANYTRWFLRVFLSNCFVGSNVFGDVVRRTDGAYSIIRNRDNPAGATDIRIGSSNIAVSPTHYNLDSPLASLLSQAQSVEVDTTLQECRIVRSGTRTPPAAETLGEVGLFAQFYDNAGTAREIMIARGIWEPTVTLTGGVTYTIGIVLKFG